MTALMTAQSAANDPNPNSVDHGDGQPVVYTCHMAALHWVYQGMGHSNAEANGIITDYVKKTCPYCEDQTGPGHASIRANRYGPDLCATATRIDSAADVFGDVSVGDILITGNPNAPSHSMIVAQKGPGTSVSIYGFNNTGTLGTGMFLQYDAALRDVTQPALWDANGEFGIMAKMPLHVVAHDEYARRARLVRFAYS